MNKFESDIETSRTELMKILIDEYMRDDTFDPNLIQWSTFSSPLGLGLILSMFTLICLITGLLTGWGGFWLGAVLVSGGASCLAMLISTVALHYIKKDVLSKVDKNSNLGKAIDNFLKNSSSLTNDKDANNKITLKAVFMARINDKWRSDKENNTSTLPFIEWENLSKVIEQEIKKAPSNLSDLLNQDIEHLFTQLYVKADKPNTGELFDCFDKIMKLHRLYRYFLRPYQKYIRKFEETAKYHSRKTSVDEKKDDTKLNKEPEPEPEHTVPIVESSTQHGNMFDKKETAKYHSRKTSVDEKKNNTKLNKEPEHTMPIVESSTQHGKLNKEPEHTVPILTGFTQHDNIFDQEESDLPPNSLYSSKVRKKKPPINGILIGLNLEFGPNKKLQKDPKEYQNADSNSTAIYKKDVKEFLEYFVCKMMEEDLTSQSETFMASVLSYMPYYVSGNNNNPKKYFKEKKTKLPENEWCKKFIKSLIKADPHYLLAFIKLFDFEIQKADEVTLNNKQKDEKIGDKLINRSIPNIRKIHLIVSNLYKILTEDEPSPENSFTVPSSSILEDNSSQQIGASPTELQNHEEKENTSSKDVEAGPV